MARRAKRDPRGTPEWIQGEIEAPESGSSSGSEEKSCKSESIQGEIEAQACKGKCESKGKQGKDGEITEKLKAEMRARLIANNPHINLSFEGTDLEEHKAKDRGKGKPGRRGKATNWKGKDKGKVQG